MRCVPFFEWYASLYQSPKGVSEQIVRKKVTKKIISRNWQLYVLLLPAVIYIFLFNYVPIYGVQIAFRDLTTRGGITGSEWVGLKHFLRFFSYPNFDLLIKNTLVLSLYTLLTFPCAVIFALMINEVRNIRFKKSIQMISYMPYFLSTVVVCSMLRLFFNENTGVINGIVELLGGERQEFLAVSSYFADIYVWSGVWQTLGWNSIIYISALAGVPEELIDAARVDGASRLQIILHVNLPAILPTVMIMLILSCGQVLNVGFEKVFLLQNPLNLSTSQVIATYVYEIGLTSGQFSYSTAIGLFNNIVNIIILILVNTVVKKISGTSVW